MRIRPRRPQHIVLPLAALALLTSHASAQADLPGLADLSSLINGGPSTTTTTIAMATATGPSPSTTAQTTKPSTTAPAQSTTDPGTTTTTNHSPTTAQQSTTPAPNQTTAFSILQILTGSLPTIAGASIPTPIVPDTSLAPFMQKSSLPEGTVFIAVGAILGFLGMGILAWRGLVAWSLHRSVKRAAGLSSHPHKPYGVHTKRPGGASKQGFYSGAGAGSSMSLDHLGPSSGKLDAHSIGTATRNSLFFSPTAGAGMHSSPAGPVPSPGSNRNSSTSHLYLPAGYYTSGSAAPAGGHSTTYVGGGSHSRPIPTPSILSPLSNLSNLAPQIAGYTRARSMVGPSTPPDSPGLTPPGYGYSGRGARQSYLDSPDRSRGTASAEGAGGVSRGAGTSAGAGMAAGVGAARPGALYPESRNMTGSTMGGGQGGPGSRTPSAYLEDLFEHHGNAMNR